MKANNNALSLSALGWMILYFAARLKESAPWAWLIMSVAAMALFLASVIILIRARLSR
jgi:hypothetical protein